MNGCKVDARTLPTSLCSLRKSRRVLVSEVAAIIIPKTDTPGAKEVGVPAFIDQLIKQCYKKEDQDRFWPDLLSLMKVPKRPMAMLSWTWILLSQKEYVKKTHDAALDAAKAGTAKG